MILVTDDHPLPKLSRYVSRCFAWPGAASPRSGEWLIRFAAEQGLQDWLLLPCGDTEVKCVAENLSGLRTVFKAMSADWTALEKVCDKQQLAATAAAAGIAFPKNYTVQSVDDFGRIEVQYPVVLKPAMRIGRNAFSASKAWRADSRDELEDLYRQASALVGHKEIVLQELVPGSGEAQFSYVALWHANAPVAEMTARRTRQYPIEFSLTSTFVEVVDNDAVKTAGRALLSSIGFEGLVEVEFKFDARDGGYKVLDVNPRTWSWFGLCEFAGLDLANLMRDVSLGKEPISPSQPRGGRAWMHVARDLIAAAQLISRGDLTVGAYLGTLGQKLTFAAFAWDDPLPGILELPLTVTRMVWRKLSLASLSKRRIPV